MAHFDSSQLPKAEARNFPVERHNARLGMWLFAIYLACYGAYVLINAFQPAWMDVGAFAGINVAIASGMALIVGALVLALVYAWFCRTGVST